MEVPRNFDLRKFNTFDKFFVDRSDADDIMDFFPKGEKARENQRDTLKKYEELSKSYKKIIICDPVGGGKTFDGKTILDYHTPGFLVTATKGLQDQVIRDFSIADMRGKNNFKCLQRMEIFPKKELNKLIKIKDYQKNKLTADYGRCSKKIDGKTVQCEHTFTNINDLGILIKQCDYKSQYYHGLRSSSTLINYTMFFILTRMGLPEMKRQISVYDEAHTIENEITKLIGIEITQKQLSDCGLYASNYDLTKFDQVILLLKKLSESYDYIIDCLEKNEKSFPDLTIDKIEKRKEKIDLLHSDMNYNQENFSFFYDDKYKKILTIKPIDLTKYTKIFLRTPRQVFLSGTINNTYFLKNLGLDPEEFGIIDNTKSYFSKEARETKFVNTISMKGGNEAQQKIKKAKIFADISKVLDKHKDDRGLILTSSKKRCDDIVHYLSTTKHKDRILLLHSTNLDGSTINEGLKKHADTPSSIIVSSSFWMGYDLKGDLARFNIIEKYPRLPWNTDPWIVQKRRKNYDWYVYTSITQLLQGFGRTVRNRDDYSITYCLDSDIANELDNNRDMIPESYHDVIPLDVSNRKDMI